MRGSPALSRIESTPTSAGRAARAHSGARSRQGTTLYRACLTYRRVPAVRRRQAFRKRRTTVAWPWSDATVVSSVFLFVARPGRVDDWRGGGRRMGVAVPGGFRDAGASLPAVAPFPVAAHRTGRADFPQPALGRDHAFAHGKLVVRTARRVSPYSFQSRSSGNRTNCPDRTLCLRQSHWRSRRVACRSIAA